MRTLERIEAELTTAKEALASVEGTPTEVYSRIVGYYRSVRNWNKGKLEEYGERRSFTIRTEPLRSIRSESDRLMLFVGESCPACPTAKAAAGRLGIPVDLINADTDTGLAEAMKQNVYSTPTAILFSAEGKELARARDAHAIAAFASIPKAPSQVSGIEGM